MTDHGLMRVRHRRLYRRVNVASERTRLKCQYSIGLEWRPAEGRVIGSAWRATVVVAIHLDSCLFSAENSPRQVDDSAKDYRAFGKARPL